MLDSVTEAEWRIEVDVEWGALNGRDVEWPMKSNERCFFLSSGIEW